MNGKNNLMPSLKVGDVVGYSIPSSWGPSRLAKGTVKTITATGRVRLENGLYFDQYGTEISSDFRRCYLLDHDEYDDRMAKVEARRKRKELISTVAKTRFESLTDDQLTRILAITQEKEE